jgi:hypothetical protein
MGADVRHSKKRPMHPARGTTTAVVIDICIDGARVACNAGEIEPDRRRLLLFH